jgi:hypothetical protein
MVAPSHFGPMRAIGNYIDSLELFIRKFSRNEPAPQIPPPFETLSPEDKEKVKNQIENQPKYEMPPMRDFHHKWHYHEYDKNECRDYLLGQKA